MHDLVERMDGHAIRAALGVTMEQMEFRMGDVRAVFFCLIKRMCEEIIEFNIELGATTTEYSFKAINIEKLWRGTARAHFRRLHY